MALDAAHAAALRFLDSLDDRPVWPRASLDDMVAEFGGPLPDEGTDAAELVADLARRAIRVWWPSPAAGSSAS